MTPGTRETTPGAFSETRRQIVHITMGAWALLLRWMTWQQAAALAIAALVFNLFVLPHVGGRRLYRESDIRSGRAIGILLYPLAVLGLVLVFRYRLDLVGAAWAILAVGDGLATIVGRAAGRHPLPWNREKTVEGTLAFIAGGGAAGVFLAWWIGSPLPFAILAPIAAAIVAALAETIPVRLDDNTSVPIAAAFTLWLASHISIDPVRLAGLGPAAAAGLALNTAVAWAGLVAGTVSASGAIAGIIIGTVIFVGAGWQGWTLLLASFLFASIASRVGLRGKKTLGIAEARGGRRGAGNALANTGIAACAAGMAIIGDISYGTCLMVLSASLVAGASDTVASEIGKAWGRRTFLVTTFRRVPPGTSGAFSLEGTLAGLIAAFALAALAGWLGLLFHRFSPAAEITTIVVASMIAMFVESALGATLEPKGILNNDLLNLVTTSTAAAMAVFVVLR
jgi:uncharacterized protein (TIGR00297 family)